MKLISTLLLLAITPAVLAEKSIQPSTLPPVLIRYRIPDHTSTSTRLTHNTEFWGFDVPDKSLRFRQISSDNSTTELETEKTLLEDDDITLKGINSGTSDEESKKNDQIQTVDPVQNEAEPNFRIFPYLLIGKTQTGDHFPFLAMLKDRKKDVKDTQDQFVPAFVAVAPEPPPVKEEDPQPQLIAAPILNLPMPLTHLVRHANPLIPQHHRQQHPQEMMFHPEMPHFLA